MTDWNAGPAAFWLMLLLGAYHGINPGMGWLFAVARGMQERSGRAVAGSLVPLAIGHTAAVAVVVLAATLLGRTVTPAALRYPVAATLIALGIYRLVRHRHPRWVRMQVGFRDLVMWSFLMASAHGAGLMVLPVVMAGSHTHHHTASQGAAGGISATLIHTIGYFTVTAAVALLVYRKFGLAMLRRAWFNLDRIWAIALVVTGLVALVV